MNNEEGLLWNQIYTNENTKQITISEWVNEWKNGKKQTKRRTDEYFIAEKRRFKPK